MRNVQQLSSQRDGITMCLAQYEMFITVECLLLPAGALYC